MQYIYTSKSYHEKLFLITLFSVAAYFANAQACLKTDSIQNAELKLFEPINDFQDRYLLFRGQSEKIKLKFIKESLKVSNELPHTEVINYCDEIMKGKLTGGKYVLTYRENQYEIVYTRQPDNKNFVFRSSVKPEHCTW